MEIQLILIAFFVTFGLPENVRSNNRQMGKKVMISEVNEGSNIQENLHNLFDSLSKNDRKKTETYRNVLQREAGREQQAFDSMKEEFRFARQRHAHSEEQNFHFKAGNNDEKATMSKREAGENNDGDNAFTEEEERNIVKELDRMVQSIPAPERHISNPNQFCINRCLQDAVTKKYEQRTALNMTGLIPLAKQPLYRKLSNSIRECVVACGVIPGYENFLLKLVEMILNPDTFIHNLARDE